MDLEKYSERLRGFIQSAQTAALSRNHQQFTAEHLLKVLVDDPEGMASSLIARAGGDPKAVQLGVEAALAAGYAAFGLSEHAPRAEARFLYPDEIAMGWDVAHLAAMFDDCAGTFGGVDIVVPNAGGVANTAPVAMMSDEEWQYELDFNINQTFWMARRALKYMVPQQHGRIIGMSSMYGKITTMAVPGYITNKHAIIGFMKALAKEVGTSGITANAVCPGFVPTDMFYETGLATVEAMGLPDLDARIERGDLGPILAWLREHVHVVGHRLEAPEIVRAAVGERDSVADLLDYLWERMGAVYGVRR